jgi:hypothetical protein
MQEAQRNSYTPNHAAVRMAQVKLIGGVGQTYETALADAIRRFRKTQAFQAALPSPDDVPDFWDAVDREDCPDDTQQVSRNAVTRREFVQHEPEAIARPDAHVAQADSSLHTSAVREREQLCLRLGARDLDPGDADGDVDLSSTQRVRALRPRSERQTRTLWQRQSPVLAFTLAAGLCAACMYAVNHLAP